MADTFYGNFSGAAAAVSANQATDAEHMVRGCRVIPFFNPVADTDYAATCLWVPDTAITVTNLDFIPSVAVSQSDTNYISLTVQQGDLAAGALTTVGTTFTTQTTGGVALTARTAQAWTVVTAGGADDVAADVGIWLVMTQTGTGPAWGGSIRIRYTLQG